MVLKWSYIGERGFRCSLNLSPNVLEDSLMIFVHGCQQEVFDGLTPFEIHVYIMFLANSFYAFTQAFCIWYHYIVSFVDGVDIGTAACLFPVVTTAFFWIGRHTDPLLYPVQDPYWIFATGKECFVDVLVLLVTAVWWNIQI